VNALRQLLPDAHWGHVSASLLSGDQRRFEARSYLTDGFGLRRRIESNADGWTTFSEVASVWQPSRLKGYTVAEGKGLPFLSAGQIFESRPRVRKWLAAPMVPALETRYLETDMIMLSCSGEVGRVTAVYEEHLDTVVTHDLLRVVPRDPHLYGWLYAYMKTRVFFEITRSAQYGHMIKHLEPEHVQAMPVVMPSEKDRAAVGEQVTNALSLRRRARQLQNEAYSRYAALVNPAGEHPSHEFWQSVPVSRLATQRRRFEGQHVNSEARWLDELTAQTATHGLSRVGEVTESVRLGARFKRFFGPTGTPYRSASELFDVNPPVTKRIFSALLDKPERYMLEPGDLIMACSGQTYGLLGRTVILTEDHQDVFGSHDLIRITPNDQLMRTGYLHTALSHEQLGRPQVVRHASGTSIPHLDPVDIRTVQIPRFAAIAEDEIADLAEEATKASQEADRLESLAIAAAATLVEEAVGVRAESA